MLGYFLRRAGVLRCGSPNPLSAGGSSVCPDPLSDIVPDLTIASKIGWATVGFDIINLKSSV